jgi:hypothetical protein
MSPDWELTATTILCEDVDDEVTIIVNGDGTARCTGSQKYAGSNKAAAKELKDRSKKLGRELACKDPGCPTVAKYREELLNKK